MAVTKIEWTRGQNGEPGFTFNPWVGCAAVSDACAHCYAEGWAKRTGHPDLWSGERRRTTETNWREPIRWNRNAEKAGIRPKVFCASLADVFDNKVPPEWRTDLWALIAETPHLDWLLLTKRPQNIRKMLPGSHAEQLIGRDAPWGYGWPNVWLGTTVENQEEADRRILPLLKIPAKVHFLSCEPLLGPLKLDVIDINGHYEFYPLEGTTECEGDDGEPVPGIPGLDWIICGGESGPGARPMHPEWARSLRDQCAAAGVPFFFKQWGDWVSPGQAPYGTPFSGSTQTPWATPPNPPSNWHGDITPVERLGKHKAGAMLDGREWREMPDAV